MNRFYIKIPGLLFLIQLVFLNPVKLSGQKITSFSIKEAVVYGLSNHSKVLKSKLDIETTRQRYNEALSVYLPQVKGYANFNNNLILPTNILPGAALGRSEDIEVKFGTQYNVNTVLEANQIIYDQSLLTGIRMIKDAKTLTELNVEKTEEQVIYDIASTYYNSQLISIQKQIIETNIRKLDTLLTITKVQLDNGFVKPVDYNRLMVNKTNLATDLQNIDINYQQQLVLLKYYMAFPLEEEIRLSTDILNENLGYSSEEELDINNSIDYRLLQVQKRLTLGSLKQLQSSYLPSFSLNFRFGFQALSNNFDFLTSTKGWYPNSVLAFNMSLPIFDGLYKKSKIQQIKIQQKQATHDENFLYESVKMQSINVNSRIQINLSSVETQKNNIKMAEEVYETTMVQYKAGVIGTSELLNAETALSEAQTNYLKALAQVKIAELEALKISGKIKSIIN